MLLVAEILWIWVFTTAQGTAALQTPPAHHPHSLLLSRLDRLESLLADHQAQFQQERHQWEKEKETLKEDLHLLQGDVHALQREKQEMRREMEALQNAHTTLMTQTLAAENQDLKAQLGDLQRQLLSVDSRQQSLQDRVIRCEGKATRPDTAGEEEELGEEDQHAPAGEQSGRAAHPWAQEGDSRLVKDPSPQHLNDDPDPFKQHVLLMSLRSDDQGPLQAVVDHLAQTTSRLTADLQALKTSDAQQRQDIQAARGSTFVRWGSSACAAGSSEVVYSGVVGGSLYTHTGAAANALCLSLTPHLLDASPSQYAELYGGEYETLDSHQDADPVCAVCRSPHPTTIMVPGTDACSAGWTLQYSGFLMAGRFLHNAATEFICVDSELEGAMRSQDDHNGYLLYYTKAACGSLPCPPYQDGKVVSCAVCSK